jgi:hypothetical protein
LQLAVTTQRASGSLIAADRGHTMLVGRGVGRFFGTTMTVEFPIAAENSPIMVVEQPARKPR